MECVLLPGGHLLDWIRDQTAPIRTGQNEYGGPSRASPLDANWINLGTIRAWRDHKCTEYPKFGSPPTWLIDVRKDCLVSPAQLRGEARYCALSYVWGQVETGKLTTETREAFCRPGAFSASSPSPVVIPKTIRHAMCLVKELGERYLWVDSLCIVQDQDTGHELANMGAIYDRATLTIVAATAWDADGGLRGLRGISGPRHLSAFGDDMSEYLDPDSMIWVCVNHSLLQTYPANTPENSRAWTFQEGQFSRRMLIFCDQTVIFKCLCRCTDEVGTDLAAQGSRGSSLAHVNHLLRGKVNRGQRFELSNLLLRGVANRGQRPEVLFDEYCQILVSPYNTRNCTRTADFPRAFEGIAHALAKTAVPGTLFSQGFCWGLPIAFLPHALTWCAAELNLRPRDQLLGFPSFSWLAWEGRIKLRTIMECGPWYVKNFESNPQARCHWDIVYPKSTSKQNSVRASGDAPRTAMKIKREPCHFEAGQFRMRYDKHD